MEQCIWYFTTFYFQHVIHKKIFFFLKKMQIKYLLYYTISQCICRTYRVLVKDGNDFCTGYILTSNYILILKNFVVSKNIQSMDVYFLDPDEQTNQEYQLEIGSDNYNFVGKKYKLLDFVNYYHGKFLQNHPVIVCNRFE